MEPEEKEGEKDYERKFYQQCGALLQDRLQNVVASEKTIENSTIFSAFRSGSERALVAMEKV